MSIENTCSLGCLVDVIHTLDVNPSINDARKISSFTKDKHESATRLLTPTIFYML